MELKEMYAMKGEYQTQVEIWGFKLRQINEQINKYFAEANNQKPGDSNSKRATEVLKP